MAHGLLLQVFWICALLFNGCLTTPKGYRYRGQSQNRNIGDDLDDEKLSSPGSELDNDQKPAARNTPTRVSSQQNMQTRPGGQAVGQLNRVAQGSSANEPLRFPLVGPANPQHGSVKQQSTATGFTNDMPPSSSGFSGYAQQSGGQSQLASDSQAPEAKGLVFEEVFHLMNSGPAQPYGAARGYDGRNFQNLYQSHLAQPAGPSGLLYGHRGHASYNEGLNSNQGETVPQSANGQFMRPPPPPYNPVYFTQSRHGYSRASYTHFHSKYSPDLYAPMPVMTVDPQPPQDVPVVREDTHGAKL